MPHPDDNSSSVIAQDMEAHYLCAQSLMQGIYTKHIAFNTTLIPHWINDSDCFWYEREFQAGKEFRLVDAGARSNEVAFDHMTMAQALCKASGQQVDARDLPISKVEMSLSPLQLSFDAFGKRWKFTDLENTCVEVETHPDSWVISPDGNKAVFVRDHNIWLRELDTDEERALTQDGEPFYCYASPPSAYGVKMTAPGLEAIWSPDSKRLFTLQVDTRSVKILPMIQHVPQDGSMRPILAGADRRMAFPGDDHVDEYRFLAIDVETTRQQDAHYRRCPVFRNGKAFFTTHHGWWGENSRHAYFIDLERGGDHVARLVEFDAQTGATRVVIEEVSPYTCFKLRLDSREPILVRSLADSDEVIWYSERSGWGHLYLYDLKTGQLKHPITEGDWLVRDIHHYDPERRELVIQTANRIDGRHAYYRDICRVNIDTGELMPVLSTDHEYIIFDEASELSSNLKATRNVMGAAGVSPRGHYIVTTRSRADTIPVSLLLDRDGNELLELETADVSGLPKGWQWPEPVKLTSADNKTDIYGVVYRPSHFSPDKTYPVVDVSWNHKEGFNLAAGSFTNNSMAGYRYLASAALAELGFIVVNIFGHGTSSRHRAFSAEPDPELPSSSNQKDRIAGIRQLAGRFPYINLDRIGAGGGFMSTTVAVSGLLGQPDFYKVGVTSCAAMDLCITPAFWGEAYAGLPARTDDRQPIYELAQNLQGKLLLMHGMLDPVIPVTVTFRLIEAFQQANKDFDMLILPNDGHLMCSYAMRRGWDYLVKHLLDIEPPREFELTTSFDILAAEYTAKQAQAAAD